MTTSDRLSPALRAEALEQLLTERPGWEVVSPAMLGIVCFRRREADFMLLDRDDRGGINDFVMVNGAKVPTAMRQEVVTIRGIIAGEYTVNIYHFAAVTGQPVPVTVMVQKINPKVTIVAKETIDLHQGGDEKTAVRFTLDAKGKVTETNRIQRSILQTFQNSSKDGISWPAAFRSERHCPYIWRSH